ncbi:MAG: type IX secretion system sortase PorU [Bacteroidetes bacterium]|nr:type IX secretion system sortase PorU [Bacteroidota bacterium]MBL6943963.1 type IX secretion system sortase PorU [Bacteroidales bacterium]
MLHQKLSILLFFFFISFVGYSFPYDFQSSIKWNGIQKVGDEGFTIERLSFEGAHYHEMAGLPVYIEKLPIHTTNARLDVSLSNQVFVPVTAFEEKIIRLIGLSDTTIKINASIVTSRKQPLVQVELIPIRWNASKHIYEKLVKFDIIADVIDIIETTGERRQYTTSSVLATGQWFKIKLDKNGIYKVTYNELSTMGFDMSTVPSRIAVFGNGGGILPEKNDEFRYDDLYENPISVVGGDDGSFDPGDYLLFYGEGPVVWKYNNSSQNFQHKTNYYKDHSYYFITALTYPAKRIQNLEPPSGDHDIEISDFTDYVVHELTERNIAGIGRTWYGEIFDYIIDYDFVFDFPNVIKQADKGFFRGNFASKAYSSNSFKISINNQPEKTVSIQPLTIGNRYEYGKDAETSFQFTPLSDQLMVEILFQRASSTSVGYLDFFEINIERELKFAGNQMMFRKIVGLGSNIAKYNLLNADQNVAVWDISNPVNPQQIPTQQEGNGLTFNADATTFHEYIAFTQTNYLVVEFVEQVPNQNLHSYRNVDYLIITHPDFAAEAENLATFHRSHGTLDVLVATIDQVYNEFSSGGQDITAIRDFAKMLYDDSDPGKELRYLLLFGDASYDYKDILPDNTNFVPCWESVRSLDIVSSIATDDYFGFLDDGEGEEFANDLVDIGIGRFVVSTPEEAQAAIDKTMHYSVNTTQVMAPWRNIVTFVADDGDANRHLKDAERLAIIFDTAFQVYNISKIYVDAYEQISTPSGQMAPAVNQAINERIEKGTLILNYSGHGGEIGLGHERIVQIPDIVSWKNYDKLSVFITATCEFTRYDDPARVSAGELVFLNEKGGAISLFTTSRATFAGSNLALNMAIFNNNLFKKIDGEYPRFGDVIRRSKLNGTPNDKKFVLIGDPACKMAYPEHRAETVKINSRIVIPDEPDTIRALQLVKIEGIVTDENGVKLTDFNGEMFTSVYDKQTEIQTYGDENPPYTFYVRNNVIFNGKASIIIGDFEFEFMVPKDIAYKYGTGRISYYFRNLKTDGNGYYENIVVGGFDENAKPDNEGPVIELFMNDTTFLQGDFTNQNPLLLAFVSDESGINTTGIGIGHDIVTVIDGDQDLTFVLNDYYEAEQNKFNKGKIAYPFDDLPDGEHNLSFKVWDVYNNSSTAFLNFLVVSAEQVVVENLMNYPNPFINETNFVFDHNQTGNVIDVRIEIFRLDGKIVRSINTTLHPEGFRSEPVTWDGSTDNGGKIGRGFYVYRVIVRNEDGAVGNDHSKLVYIR